MFSWLSFLSYAALTTATPGPNNIMSMSNASRIGLRRSLPFNIGIWAGFSLVMLLCTLFCNTLTELIPKIKIPMMIAGACYMLWLAWKTFTSTSISDKSCEQITFTSGLLLQFVNPKIYVYGIVSMQTYILPFYQGQWVKLIFFAILLATIGAFFNICWALFGSIFKLLFSQYAKITNTIMALLLVYCAASLFF